MATVGFLYLTPELNLSTKYSQSWPASLWDSTFIPRGKGQMSHTLSVACRTERESPKGPAWSNHSSPLLQSGQSLWFWGEGRECEEWGERWLLKSFTFTSSYIHSLLNQWVKYQRPVECRFPCLMNLLDSVFYLGPQ